jgi:hypothetical protein
MLRRAFRSFRSSGREERHHGSKIHTDVFIDHLLER